MTSDHITPGKHSSELFGEFSARWIDSYAGKDPYFCYISFMAPHDPRTMPADFRSMYRPEEIRLPGNYLPEHPFDYGIRDLRDEVLAPYPRLPEEVQTHIAEYYGMISHLDHEIGKVLEAVEKRGEIDNTLFLFAGDNGLALGQHGLFGKQNHYEHSIRVPLIMAGPGIPEGRTEDAYVYLLDIFPTLCEYLGIEIPSTVEGRSLYPLLTSDSAEGRESLYFAYTDTMRGVKKGGYKLIEYASPCCRRTQLFNLNEDPLKMRNLYGREEYSDQINDLRKELFRLRDEWEDRTHRMGRAFWQRYSM